MNPALPAQPLPAQAWHEHAGRIGLYALLLFYQLNATVAYVGLDLTILAFLAQAPRWWPLLKREPVARLLVAIVLYLLAYAGWAAHEFPASAPAQWMAVSNWLHWLAFPPVAWQIHTNRRQLNWLLASLAAGLLIRVLIHVEWGRLADIFHWPRTGFGYVETVFGPLAGVTALGLLLLAPRCAAAISWRRLRVGLALAGLLVALEALVLSQTRGALLAALLVFPLGVAGQYGGWLRRHAKLSAKTLALALVLAVAAGLFVRQNAGLLADRLQFSAPSVEQLDRRDAASAPARSIGYRLVLWRIGLEQWQRRPLLGWGPGSTEMLLQQVSEQALTQADGSNLYPHLHSHYLEFLVRFGLLGSLLFAALPGLLLRGVWQAGRRGTVPWDYARFLLAGSAFTAIVMAFDFQIFKFAWRNYCLIWAALGYAVCLDNLTRQPQ